MSLRDYKLCADKLVSTADARGKIIESGRMLMLEAGAKAINMDMALAGRKGFSPFTLSLNADNYGRMNAEHMKALLNFAAERACSAEGSTWSGKIEDVTKRSMTKNPIFTLTLANIMTEVVTPVMPIMSSDILGKMAKVVSVGHGRTQEILVKSNAVLVFEDIARGAEHSVPKRKVYNDVVTLNPQPFAATGTLDLYKLLSGVEDMGALYNAITGGLYNKYTTLFTAALLSAITDTALVPTYLKADSYTSDNFANLAWKAALANNVKRNQMSVYGAYPALKKVLPTVNSLATALTMGLGQEWMKYGYVDHVDQMPLFEIQNAFKGNTVNTTGTTVFPTDKLFFVAQNGDAPMYIGIEEGEPITVELTPDKTTDGTFELTVISSADVQPVFGSKIAVMNGVV